MRYPFRMKFQDTTMLICSMILCEAQQNIRVIHKRNKEKETNIFISHLICYNKKSEV